MVNIGNKSSSPTYLATGVPQHSVLGPILFSIYTSPFASLAFSFSVPQQQHADDTQLCISLSIPVSWSNPQSRRLPHRPASARLVLTQFAIPQSRQSESVLFGSRASRTLPLSMSRSRSLYRLANHVKLLGVTLDNHLSMDKHLNEVSRACFIYIYITCIATYSTNHHRRRKAPT